MNMSDVSSLDEALSSLEKDLFGGGGGIAAQSGIPFAILRYAPGEEFVARRKLRLFAHAAGQQYRKVSFISLSRMVWNAVKESDGSMGSLFETELEDGFDAAQLKEVTNLIDGKPDKKTGEIQPLSLSVQILARIASFPQKPDLVFLVRTGGLAPNIYRSSTLLHELQMGGLTIPTILCYPGSSVVGTDLRFFDLGGGEGLGAYNYRVKIYGTN